MLNEARAGKLTASRVAPLMNGDAMALHQLWLEMTGQAERPDISLEWPVWLGVTTESRHLDWLQVKEEIPVVRRGEFVVHPRHSFFACTLDAWHEDLMCPIEVKHTQGFQPFDVVVERYKAQCHFQMACCNAPKYLFSVILGAARPVLQMFDLDHEYAAELMGRALRFWDCVQSRTPPGPLPEVMPSPDTWHDYDMTQHQFACDEWRMSAEIWLQSRGAAESCAEAAKALKALVPDDARRAWGAGVVIKRNRGGSLSLRSDV